MKKRAFAFLLALAMVLALLPVTALAAEEEAFTLGETKTLTLEPNATITYKFTATEDAKLALYSPYGEGVYDEASGNYYGQDFSFQMRCVKDSTYAKYVSVSDYNARTIEVTAGNTYEITVSNYTPISVTNSVTLEEVKPAESIAFKKAEYYGFVGEWFYTNSTLSPTPCFETCTWTVGDPSLFNNVEDYYSGNYFGAEPVKTGTTTLTVTTESGKTATCNVIIKEKGTFTLGESKTLTLKPNEKSAYTFTAQTDGSLCLYMPYGEAGEYDGEYLYNPCFDIEMQDGDYNWANFVSTPKYTGRQIEVKAGTTYTITVWNYMDVGYTGTVTLTENIPLTSFTLSETEINEFVDEYYYLDVIPTPDTAFDTYTWSIADTSICDLDWYSSSGCGIVGKKAGTTTLTATSSGGLTATCTITIKDKEAISVGDSKTLALDSNDRTLYSFTAQKDGDVVVYMPYGDPIADEDGELWSAAFGFTMYNSDYSAHSSYVGNDNYSACRISVKAGKTYTLEVYNYLPSSYAGTFNLIESIPLTSFTLSDEPYTAMAGSYVYVTPNAVPELSFDTYTWTLSDESVCKIQYSGPSYCQLSLLKPGTCVLTATASNGMTASVSITVTEAPVFTDVPAGEYYAEAVNWAVANGITNGYGSAETFAPEVACTRGQIVTFLWRAHGSPEPKTTVNPFTDVVETDFFYKAVLWAVENNITAGYGSDTIFNPMGECTRAQVATFLWRAQGEPKPASSANPFTDVPADAYYYNAVLWAVEMGVTKGYGSDTIYAPDITCTRGQIVTFLYRALV